MDTFGLKIIASEVYSTKVVVEADIPGSGWRKGNSCKS